VTAEPGDPLAVAPADPALGRVFRGGAWLASASAVGAVLLVAQGIITTRVLGPTGLGIVAIVVAVVMVTRLLLSFRMSDVVVRFVAPVAELDAERAAAWVALAALAEAGTALACWFLIVAIGPTVAGLFVSAEYGALVLLYAVVIPAGVVAETALGVLQVYRRFDLQALAQLVERVVTLVAVALVAAQDWGIAAFVLASATGPVIGGMLLTALAWTVAARRIGPPLLAPRLALVAAERPEALRFALATNAAGSLSMVTKDADPLWLGWLRTPAEAGLYRLAYSVGSLLFLPVAPLSQTVYPEAAQLASASRGDALRRLVSRASRPVAAYAVLLLVLSLLFGRPVLAAVYGAEFGVAGPALTVLIAGIGIGAVTFWARPVVLATGGAGFALAATAAAAVAKVALVLLLLPRHGFVVNAWALAAAYGAGAAMLAWRSARALRPAERAA
jgi:O-antigen/teichoic acid export membrane protein